MKIVLYDCGGHVQIWLKGLISYLEGKGNDVRWWDQHWSFSCKDPNKWESGFWDGHLRGADLAFCWGKAHPVYKEFLKGCDRHNVHCHSLEVAWFPQSKFYFTDPNGINASASIMEDDLMWVGKTQFEKLERLRETYLQGREWKGGDCILVPLQVDSDTNVVLHSKFTNQSFIEHVEKRFEGKRILFKKHPKNPDNHKLRTNCEWVDGNFLDLAQNAGLVYGMNSTCLLEAALMKVPCIASEACYLSAHNGQVERLLAALADKQIPVGETELDYWFAPILGESRIGSVPVKRDGGGVAVVVSSYNQLKTLPMFLESMYFQTLPPRLVVIADDGSTDGTEKWVQENADKYPFELLFTTRENKGYRLASLNNMGAWEAIRSEASFARILFTNADVVHHPRSIECHEVGSGVVGGIVDGIGKGAVGAVSIDSVRDFRRIERIQKNSPSERSNRQYIKSSSRQNCMGLWGGNLSVPKEDFVKAGGFDPDLKGWGGEEVELVYRMRIPVSYGLESVAIHLDHEVQPYSYEQKGTKYMQKKLENAWKPTLDSFDAS
jgi:GT2 family glycosyltransferase